MDVHRSHTPDPSEPIVITGIGMVASVGNDRESVWQAVREGVSGVRHVGHADGMPDCLRIAAPVSHEPEEPGRLKVISLALQAAAEALDDARVYHSGIDFDQFGCSMSAHMCQITDALINCDTTGPEGSEVDWRSQCLPNSGCSIVANRFGLHGPRACHSAACASGMIDILSAVRSIRDGQCDIALAGSSEALDPLFAAGFSKMRVLAEHDDPTQAARPFDSGRNGFVMGEGAAMFVLERLSHARRRGASIYAEVIGGRMVADAYHVTGVDADSPSLTYLLTATMKQAGLVPSDVGYINAHGTGTQSNDIAETRGIRSALGRAADSTLVSSTKSMLGHLVNASGSVELGVTALALRDGFAPPTVNLTHPDPDCNLDCIPLVGRFGQFEHAVKVSIAFGGTMAAIALRRWPEAQSCFGEPARKAA
jgi:3-oxoacyl-[acyl-carrier-protein] synthase II